MTQNNIKIRFESASGATLQQRFNKVSRYYAGIMKNDSSQNHRDWIAREAKKSLIRNIENGTIVIEQDGVTIAWA